MEKREDFDPPVPFEPDGVLPGYREGVAAECERLAPVIEAAVDVYLTNLGFIPTNRLTPAYVRVDVKAFDRLVEILLGEFRTEVEKRKALRDAGLLEEPKP